MKFPAMKNMCHIKYLWILDEKIKNEKYTIVFKKKL